MRSRKKLNVLRSKKSRRIAYKATGYSPTYMSAPTHINIIRKPKQRAAITTDFDRIDLLACLFASYKIE
jgi:hypothetical protein